MFCWATYYKVVKGAFGSAVSCENCCEILAVKKLKVVWFKLL
jgi:hypothetical protein